MELALYHPDHGYYAKSTNQVGRDGDFFTSVSVGPLFGRLLARRFLTWWHQNGSPQPWRILEAGAHDGTLAADILTEIRALDSNAFASLDYVIPEPLPRLREAQRAKLSGFPGVRIIESLGGLASQPLPGVAFGNEVLDALPFHVIERRDGRWQECRVQWQDGSFRWVAGPDFADGPAGDFPEGYRTEIRRNYGSFFLPFLEALTSGTLFWFDYGYGTGEYYHPARSTGTIRTFSKHRAGEDPLASPGVEDITAHVDFTAAAEQARELGCRVTAFRTQSAWLTEVARELLLAMEGKPDAAVLRQFQTLTHPGHLGSRFHVLELSWNDPTAPSIPDAGLKRLP